MEQKKCILHMMDGSKSEFDITDHNTVHSLLHLLYLTDLTHIYTLYREGDEHPIYTNTSLDTFEVNSENNSISLFALKKELTEDITSQFENKTWGQIISRNNLQSIYDLFSTEQLTTYVENCFLINLTPISHLTNLLHLYLLQCYELVNLKPLEILYNLNSIKIDDCPKIIDVRPISKLSNLRKLNIINCNQIVNADCRMHYYNKYNTYYNMFSHTNRLYHRQQRINKRIAYEKEMKDIGLSISQMTNLKELYINECKLLVDIGQFVLLTNLDTLHIINCPNIKSDITLENMTTLRDLQITNNIKSSNRRFDLYYI